MVGLSVIDSTFTHKKMAERGYLSAIFIVGRSDYYSVELKSSRYIERDCAQCTYPKLTRQTITP